jgi:hypothetical protein
MTPREREERSGRMRRSLLLQKMHGVPRRVSFLFVDFGDDTDGSAC